MEMTAVGSVCLFEHRVTCMGLKILLLPRSMVSLMSLNFLALYISKTKTWANLNPWKTSSSAAERKTGTPLRSVEGRIYMILNRKPRTPRKPVDGLMQQITGRLLISSVTF